MNGSGSGPWAGPLWADGLRSQDLLEAAPDAMVGVDPRGLIRFVNRQTELLFGYERSEILGQSIDVLVPEQLREAHVAHRRRYGRHPTARPMGAGLDLAGRRKDGTQFPVDISLTSIETNDGPLFVAAVRDVTQRKLHEEALRQAEERFRSAFEDAPIGMALLALDGTALQINDALCRLLGCSGEDLLAPAGPIVVAGEPLIASTLRDRMLARETRLHRDERRLARPDGRVIWLVLTVSLLPDARGVPSQFLVQVEDISAAKQAEAQLVHQAVHDPLTDLPNRTLLVDRLTQALARSQRRPSLTGVMFVDLDRFKAVNDTLGHDAGDRLLVEVARRIKGVLRRGDTAARLGGDEFVLMCEDLADDEEGVEIARRVGDLLALPFTVQGRELAVGASIGVVLTREPASMPEAILRNADAAMYRAKQRGGGRVEVFDDGMRLQALNALDLESGLPKALEANEFSVLYQPQASMRTGKLVGFEALVRWNHPVRGLLHPVEFIPVAEELGLMVPLGTWVLEKACREAASWLPGHRDLTLSVNLSPRQCGDPDLAASVARILEETRLPPAMLCLEVGESALMGAFDPAMPAVNWLRELGVRFSIDDFGTGCASLAALAEFHPDEVKVDQSLIQHLGQEPESALVVSAAIKLAHHLGLCAVAEGAETAEQLDLARSLECDVAQGYLLGRPRGLRATRRLLRRPPRWWEAEGHREAAVGAQRGS